MSKVKYSAISSDQYDDLRRFIEIILDFIPTGIRADNSQMQVLFQNSTPTKLSGQPVARLLGSLNFLSNNDSFWEDVAPESITVSPKKTGILVHLMDSREFRKRLRTLLTSLPQEISGI